MSKTQFDQATDYELLAQAVYQALLRAEGINNIEVKHNITLRGKSGVSHQIDVFWRFQQANIEHTVLVECKNYTSMITLKHVRNFHSAVTDVGNARGIMVTKVGYQSGAEQFAESSGIGLKLLRKPTDKDWVGKVRTLQINLRSKMAESSVERPISISAKLSDEFATFSSGSKPVAEGPSMKLYDMEGNAITEEFRHWIPRQLPVLDKNPGGLACPPTYPQL